MAKFKKQFAFKITDGPNAGLAQPGWILKVNKSDIYLMTSTTGHRWKLSLHGDRSWRFAQTAEHARSEGMLPGHGARRIRWDFSPPAFVNESRRSFAIGVTRAAMLPLPVLSSETVIPVEDRWDRMTTLFLEETRNGADLVTPRHILFDPLPLTDGRLLWLTVGSQAVEHSGTPEPQAATAAIFPMAPDTHDVRFPGALVKGMRLKQ